MSRHHPHELKDDSLARLAESHNVAQFVSFGPGVPPFIRHSCVRGYRIDSEFDSALGALQSLLAASNAGHLNVRAFKPSFEKGGPFEYGIKDPRAALKLVEERANDGYYSIVNETIDVHDGGVSGVALDGLIEFAPDDTPRCVDKPGTVQFPLSEGEECLRLVYGARLNLHDLADQRVEFSVHPLAVGYRSTNVILWETEPVATNPLNASVFWPNHFSQLIGDKSFGLLVGHLIGLPVPETLVISRRVAPFVFGLPTGISDTWIRTCPMEPVPGRFATQRGWLDPFELLNDEDPEHKAIAAVLAQKGVPAMFSGATMPGTETLGIVEGVPGFGDAFMQGQAKPTPLPGDVEADVFNLLRKAQDLLGPVRLEWAHDGSRAWLMQLHLQSRTTRHGVIYPGEPRGGWLEFHAGESLEALERIIVGAKRDKAGVVVVGDVGLTSHVGDLLRRAKVPARILTESSGIQNELFARQQ